MQMSTSDLDALVSSRLPPHTLPLSEHVRLACGHVREAVFRLTDKVPRGSIEHFVHEGDHLVGLPNSIRDAQQEIHEVVALLASLDQDALDANPDVLINQAFANGMVFELTAEQYARDWMLPQFNFHVMTAYAILLIANVELGKADHTPHMLKYIRFPDVSTV